MLFKPIFCYFMLNNLEFMLYFWSCRAQIQEYMILKIIVHFLKVLTHKIVKQA